MSPFIVFDVSDTSAIPQIITGMRGLGYYTSWNFNNNSYLLPHNCLWRADGLQQKAMDDLTNVVNGLNVARGENNKIRIDRCIVLQIQPWIGKPNQLPTPNQ